MHCSWGKMFEIKEVEKKNNPFLKRTDLVLSLIHKGMATPSRNEVIQKIAEKYGSKPEHIEISYIFTQTGLTESIVKARIWKEKIIKREEKPKEEKKEEVKEEKPKEEAKPEEKIEEKKEQPKVKTTEKPKEGGE